MLYTVYFIRYTVYMPNVTLYIRKEDMNKWRALENKSQVISRLLNAGPDPIITKEIKVKVPDGFKATINGKPMKVIKTAADAKKIVAEEVCTGHPNFRRNCGRKGCEY